MSKVFPVLQAKFLNKHVTDLLPEPAISVSAEALLLEALASLEKSTCGAITITKPESGALLGILTERDVLNKIEIDDERQLTKPVAEIMTKEPMSIQSTASVARTFYELESGKFRHLPVINRKKDLIGIVSSKHIVDYVYEEVIKKVFSPESDAFIEDSKLTNFLSGLIEDLVPAKPIVVPSSAELGFALKKMRSNKVGSIAVLDRKNRLAGIFTEHDYLKRAIGKTTSKTPISNLMTPTPITALISTSINLAFSILSEKRIRHIPVVDHLEELIGMLSVRNFINFISKSIMSDIAEFKK